MTLCITSKSKVSASRAHMHETREGKARTIGVLGRWLANEEVIWFDVAVDDDQVLLVYCLHTRDLPILFSGAWPKVSCW
jgi:hypothetical protein